MIQQPVILLHEESLTMMHPVFHVAPKETQVIYVWDDRYIQRTGYSLKRLIFIYETLCELKLNILHGDTQSILQEINPSLIYIPNTNNPLLLEIIDSIRKFNSVELVADYPFISFKKPVQSKRFFPYWNEAQKTAFLRNGGVNA